MVSELAVFPGLCLRPSPCHYIQKVHQVQREKCHCTRYYNGYWANHMVACISRCGAPPVKLHHLAAHGFSVPRSVYLTIPSGVTEPSFPSLFAMIILDVLVHISLGSILRKQNW